MEISFDPLKRDWTLRERGLDFADAPIALGGPSLTLADSRFAYPEPRYQTYGWLDERMVLIAWTPAEDGIRVISMRHCHGKEQRRIAPRMG
jgi:uncharacterized DUF497 family protein